MVEESTNSHELDTLRTEGDYRNPSEIPFQDEVYKNPLPGSIVREGDFIGYDEEGSLYVVKASLQDEVHAHYTAEAMNFQVAGYLDAGSASFSHEDQSATGEELFNLAEDLLEEKNSPKGLVETKEGYGEVKLTE